MVGDLAHNHGAQMPLAPGTYSGDPGSPVDQKAAFNNFPYQYGVVERTFSEHQASLLSQTLVSDFPNLPPELQAGAIQRAYESAQLAEMGGDYEDGTQRLFTCQSWRRQAVEEQGGPLGGGCGIGVELSFVAMALFLLHRRRSR